MPTLPIGDETGVTDAPVHFHPRQASIDLELDSVVSSLMSCADIVSLLARHNCQDLTSLLSAESCTHYPIANGGFGDIYRGMLDNRRVAIKTIRVFESHEPGKYHKSAAHELYTWSKCKHPNIVELMGMVMFRGSLAMISVWAENGTLRNYLRRNPSADRCQLSTQICRGLAYLHSNCVIHGDLKGDNILISHDGTPMLNDFGNASAQNPTLQFSRTTTGIKYTTRWAAPEILMEATSLTYEADIYALGMTLLETFTGEIPYANVQKDFAVINLVLYKKEVPTRPMDVLPKGSFVGDQIWDLLVSCWSSEMVNRPTAMSAEQIMHSVYQYKLDLSRTHGLFVGIDNYKSHARGDLGGLGECVDNAKSMLNYFLNIGVPQTHLLYLLDEKATREGILDAFESHIINNSDIEPHDPIVVYFAGHGCRMKLPPGWRSIDKNIDTILPYVDTEGRDEEYSQGMTDLILMLNRLCGEKHNNIMIILDLVHPGREVVDKDEVIPRSSRALKPSPNPATFYGQLKRFFTTTAYPVEPNYNASNQTSVELMSPNSVARILLISHHNDEQEATNKYQDDEAENGTCVGVLATVLLKEFRKYEAASSTLINRLLEARRDHYCRSSEGLTEQTFRCKSQGRDRRLCSVQSSISRDKMALFPTPHKFIHHVRVGSAHGIVLGTEFGVFSGNMDPTSPPVAILVAKEVGSTDSYLHFLEPHMPLEIPENAYTTIIKYNAFSNRVRVWIDDTIKQNEFWRYTLTGLDSLPVTWTTSPENCDVALMPSSGGVELRGTHRTPERIDTSHLLECSLGTKRLAEILASAIYFYFHLGFRNPDAPVRDNLKITLQELRMGGSSLNLRYWPKGGDLFGNSKPGGALTTILHEPGKLFGITLANQSKEDLYPYLLYYNLKNYCVGCLYKPSDQSIGAPLPAGRTLTIGDGSGPRPFRMNFVDPDSDREQGAFVLLVFSERADISHLLQVSPFTSGRDPSNISEERLIQCLPEGKRMAGIWDSIIVWVELVKVM